MNIGIENLAAAINKPVTAEDSDYYGNDGLLYCGKCHTPKQMRNNKVAIPLTILCACQEKARHLAEREELMKQRDELRRRCLPRAAMRKHTFANADNASHIDVAKNYIDNWDNFNAYGGGLVFWGNVGTGKSYAAHCIANALIDKGIPVKYYTSVDLVAKAMSNSTSRDELEDGICSAPLLIIDDLGAERDTAYAQEQLCSFIDCRVESGKPMILTTNYTIDELKGNKPYDGAMERIIDRIREACIPVKVAGESRRKKIGEENMRNMRSILMGNTSSEKDSV